MEFSGSINSYPCQFLANSVKNFVLKCQKCIFSIILPKTCISYPNFGNFSKINYRGYIGAKMNQVNLEQQGFEDMTFFPTPLSYVWNKMAQQLQDNLT